MAVTMTALTSGTDTTAASTYTTASITTTTDSLVLLTIVNTKATVADPTSITGTLGGTWVKVNSADYNTVAIPNARVGVWRKMSAGATGTVAINFAANQTGCAWSIAEFAGVDTTGTHGSGAVVQSTTNAADSVATDFTVTLAAFSSANNATYGGFGWADNSAATSIGAGFTQIHQVGYLTPSVQLLTQWRNDNDTTVEFNPTGTKDCGGVAIEIKAGASTTVIGKDLDLRWAVESAVSKDLDLQWAVEAPVGKDLDLRWAVESAVSKDLDLQWAVEAPVSKDLDLQWAIEGPVSKDLDIQWAVEGPVSKDLDLQWGVTTSVSKDLDLRWAVESAVSKDLDLQWAVEAPVSKDLDLRWAVDGELTTVSKDLDLRWAVDQCCGGYECGYPVGYTDACPCCGGYECGYPVGYADPCSPFVAKDLNLQWAVEGPVAKDLDLRWDVLITTTLLSKDLDLRWVVDASVVKDVDLRWAVISGFGDMPPCEGIGIAYLYGGAYFCLDAFGNVVSGVESNVHDPCIVRC